MKQFIGTVTSYHQPTAIVKVTSSWSHPIYKKTINRSRHYPVHAPDPIQVGSRVIFSPTRPLSKTKKWKIIKVITS